MPHKIISNRFILALSFFLKSVYICLSETTSWENSLTDIDYEVFTDSSRLLLSGRSPYTLKTFRYSPIIAYLAIPNVLLHHCMGKIMFTLVDFLCVYLILRLSELKSHEKETEQSFMKKTLIFWVLNPIVFPISPRGNFDSLVTFLILWTLLLLSKNRNFLAGIVYGLSVHLRIYPLIYSLIFTLLILAGDGGFNALRVVGHSTKRLRVLSKSKQLGLFVTGAAVTFLGTLGGSYYLYGKEFIYSAYLYHLARTDVKHNFSVYFYAFYLNDGSRVLEFDPLFKMFPFLAQAALIFLISVKTYKKTFLAMFLVTYVFVFMNKVYTAQYIVWYSVFIPLALPRAALNRKLLWLLLGWLFSYANWLYWAEMLEGKGVSVFMQLWLSTVFLFSANALIFVFFLRSCHAPARVKDS